MSANFCSLHFPHLLSIFIWQEKGKWRESGEKGPIKICLGAHWSSPSWCWCGHKSQCLPSQSAKQWN